jgi:hypothetical protein
MWGADRKWMVIAGFQILSQNFTHDKIKTGLLIILGLVTTKKEGISYSRLDKWNFIFPARHLPFLTMGGWGEALSL